MCLAFVVTSSNLLNGRSKKLYSLVIGARNLSRSMYGSAPETSTARNKRPSDAKHISYHLVIEVLFESVSIRIESDEGLLFKQNNSPDAL